MVINVTRRQTRPPPAVSLPLQNYENPPKTPNSQRRKQVPHPLFFGTFYTQEPVTPEIYRFFL